MANTPSAKKDAKRSAVRAQRNRSIRSAVKTKVTKFRRGIAEGAEGAQELVATAIAALDRAVSKGVLHRNNAARRKARLMRRLNASAAASAPAPAAPARGAKSASGRGAASAKGATAAKTTTRSKSASKR